MVTVRITSLARLSWGVRGQLPVVSAAGCASLDKEVPDYSREGLSRRERETEAEDPRELTLDFVPGGEYARYSRRRDPYYAFRGISCNDLAMQRTLRTASEVVSISRLRATQSRRRAVAGLPG